MDLFSAKRLLDIQIGNANRILNSGFGVNHAEATLFDVINLLRSETPLKQYFLEKVVRAFSKQDPGEADSDMVPVELVELVAHELRWIELQELAQKRIEDIFNGNTALATGDVACNIVEAYSDNWPDREFYQRYRCHES